VATQWRLITTSDSSIGSKSRGIARSQTNQRYACLSTWLLPVWVSVCLPVCLSVWLPGCLPVCLASWLPACLLVACERKALN